MTQDPVDTGTSAAGKHGLTIDAPTTADLIRVTGNGFWTPAEVDSHFGEYGRLVRSRRQAGRQVRVLVDLRGSEIQSSVTVEHMAKGVASTHEEGDRVAIIVVSSLAKLQMRRTLVSSQHEFFVSPEAALKWVSAY